MPQATVEPSLTVGPAPAYPIASVDKALALVHLVRQRQVVRLTEVSHALKIAPSTAHRLLAMLGAHGFVVRDPDTRAYVVGPALSDPQIEAEAAARARPMLQAVVREIGETVHVCALEATSVRFVDSIEANTTEHIGSRKGVTLPAHCTAAGKALLSQLPLEAVSLLYHSGPLVALSPGSITEFTALERELVTIREVGWASNRRESESDVVAVAAAVEGDVSLRGLAVAVAGPAERMTEDRVRRLGPLATIIASRLGTLLRS